MLGDRRGLSQPWPPNLYIPSCKKYLFGDFVRFSGPLRKNELCINYSFKILTTKEHVGKSETLPMTIFTFCLVIIGQNQPAPYVDVLVVNPFENQSQEDKS